MSREELKQIVVASTCNSEHKNPSDQTTIPQDKSRPKASSRELNASSQKDDSQHAIKPTAKRYFILLLYCICATEKSFQYIGLSTITNKVSKYYGVDNIAVNWTSVLFMITLILLLVPTSWLVERIGLRKAILFGSGGLTLGAIVNCFGCTEDRFYIVIIGQMFASFGEQFIFCIPARVASVWFPDHQVSLATGFGIFGNHWGIALGFLLPQSILSGMETREEIGNGLYGLFLYTAIIDVATLAVLVIFFDDAPKFAPGSARLRKQLEEDALNIKHRTFWEELKEFGSVLQELLKNRNCTLLTVAFGINVGILYAIQTLLNQLVTSSNWPNSNLITGTAGLLVVLAGMIGAIFWGHICDITHRYIFINKTLYLGALASLLLLGFTLRFYNHWWLYCASGLVGFFTIGYNAVGLDTVVELTYPAPELVSTSLMNISPQVFGTGITFIGSVLVDTYRSDVTVAFLMGLLIIGLVPTYLVRETLARQDAVKERVKQHEQNP